MSDFIDTEEVILLSMATATAIQNAFIKNNWTGHEISKERRLEYAQTFMAFLRDGVGRFSFRKEVLAGGKEYIEARLQYHQHKRTGVKTQEELKQLCADTISHIRPERILILLQERAQETEDLHQTLLELPSMESKITQMVSEAQGKPKKIKP